MYINDAFLSIVPGNEAKAYAALGALAALLLAPKSGRDLRADVTALAGDWKNQAADRLAQGRESLVNAVESTTNPSNA